MDWGYVSGIIILFILGITVFAAFKKHKNDKAAEDFINGLADKVLKITMETINDSSAEGYTDFDIFSNTLINNVYAATWDYVKYTAEEAIEVNQITKAVFKLIDKETVRNFVNTMLEEKGVYDKIYSKFATPKIENLIENQEEPDVYDEKDYYTKEVVNVEDLEPAQEKEPTEEELASINPPSEEENEYVDLEDDSVEIIVDRKEIISQKTEDGQIKYYEIDKDGKKTRVTEEYAMQHMEG